MSSPWPSETAGSSATLQNRIGELMRRVDRRVCPGGEGGSNTGAEGRSRNSLIWPASMRPDLRRSWLSCSPRGCAEGEALGLQWSDIDFESSSIAIRRAITLAGLTTPKSGSERLYPAPTRDGDIPEIPR